MSVSRLFLLSVVVGACQVCCLDSASAGWTNSLQPKGKPVASLTLAEDGKTDYVIVIASEPTTQDRKAGSECL